jgi:hypothetical protein
VSSSGSGAPRRDGPDFTACEDECLTTRDILRPIQVLSVGGNESRKKDASTERYLCYASAQEAVLINSAPMSACVRVGLHRRYIIEKFTPNT